MRALIQRVVQAAVTVVGEDGLREVTGRIETGLCVLVGVTHSDTDVTAAKLAAKVWNLRVFDDEDGVMNRSAAEDAHGILAVSQFTLYGNTEKGRRPSYVEAARPEHAEPCFDAFCAELTRLGAVVETGRFRTAMEVSLVNDGPVTLLIEV